MKRLIQEIHRRSLWQVLGIYLAGAWGALQVVESVTGSAGLPDWAPGLAFVLLVIGLPVVVATAFVQEGLPGREPEGPADSGAAVDGTGPAGAVAPTANLAAGTGSLDRLSTRPPTYRRLLTWRNALLGGVGAFALWGVIAAGWLLLGGGRTAGRLAAAGDAPDRRSIAVLPFETRSTAPEDSFFTEGIHDDILTQLSKIEALKVISRTSVMQYEGTRKSIREIAEELGVATVLEGGVQRAGSSVRVTAQLIDAETDEHLWADNYDEALSTENIFAIQTQVARAIARALETRLTQAEESRIAERPTENLEAYDLYSQGRYLSRQGTIEARRSALQLFRRATELDPEFAAAHASLAATYLNLVVAGVMSAADAVAPARSAIERALALDPELPAAHNARGFLFERIERDFDGAERAYRRAIELNPGSAGGHANLGGLYVDRGRIEESRAELRRAVELDPLALAVRANLAFVEFANRDYPEAEVQARRVLELNAQLPFGYYILGAALTFQDRHAEAIAAAERAAELDTAHLGIRVGLGFVHARAGNREQALAIAEEVERRGGSLKEVALVHAALGDIERAFAYLERALESDPGDLNNLDIDPSADPLRHDSRYRDLLRRAGIE